MKKLTLFLFSVLLFSFFNANAQCDYRVDLIDSWGDGWNGGLLTIELNGTPVLTDITLAAGSGPESYYFTVNPGDAITATYTAGSFSSENEYYVYDSDAVLIFSDGTGGITPAATATIGTAACPTCLMPTLLSATNITDVAADLVWTENGTATTWNIELGAAGFAPTGTPTQAGVTTNPYTYAGLTPTTAYDFYVQADCGGGDLSVWSGPFTFTTLASCPDPANLTASNIMSTQADLSWDGFFATAWNIELGITGFVPTGTPTQTSVTNPFTHTGLAPNTVYDYYVQADCGSNWIGPFTFTTLCNTFTAPYFEDFENAGIIPNCWVNETGDDNDWSFGTATPSTGTGPQSGDHTTGTGYFAYTEASGNNNQVMNLSSPMIDVSALTVPQLRFFYHMFGTDMGTLSIDVFDGTTWTTGIWSISGDQGDVWYETLIDLSTYGTVLQIRFSGLTGAGFESDISIDDVEIRETPTCPEPVALDAINIGDVSADLIWTETGTATVWNIEWDITGFTPGTGNLITGVTTNPYSLTGLSPVTSYDFYVRAVCGAGDSSLWVGPFSFTTTACPASQQCTFSLDLADSFGDGWNGASVDVIQDGNVVGTYTINNGYSASFNILLCDSSFIELSWTQGTYDNECGMSLAGPYGNLIYEFIPGNAPAANGVFYSFMASCSPPPPANLVITEIMYNPPESGADSLEFFEIYNNDTVAVDMQNYTLAYNTNTHVFDMTVINPGQYVVVAIDSIAFETFYGFAPIQCQSTTGVGNGGATVTLHNDLGQLVDSVVYDDIAPWPTEPDGTGPSLVLCDYNGDNNNGNNWFASTVFVGTNGAGTDVFASPGAQDSVCLSLPVDLAIVFPDTANYDCGLSSTESVPYCISNVGQMTVLAGDTIFLYYEYPIGNVVADTLVLAADLVVGDTVCGTFTQTVDFSAIGVYDFEIYFDYFNDTIVSNNIVVGFMEHYEVVVDLGGINDTITVSSYPTTLDAGTCNSPNNYNCYYMWADSSTAQTLNVNADGWYYVTVTDDNWCSGTDSVYVVLNIGIDNTDNEAVLNIYPNPVNNILNIEMSLQNVSNTVIDLVNVQGQLIERRMIENTMGINEKFDVKNVSPGVYYIKITSGNIVKFEKVVIQ